MYVEARMIDMVEEAYFGVAITALVAVVFALCL